MPAPPAAPPCELALTGGLTDLATGTDSAGAALSACGAIDVHATGSGDGRLVWGNVAGTTRAVLVVPGAMGEVRGDGPLTEPPGAVRFPRYSGAGDVVVAARTDAPSEAWVYTADAAGALSVRVLRCESGRPVVFGTTCGRAIACSSDRRVRLLVRGQLVSDDPCLRAVRAVQDAAWEALQRVDGPYDAIRAPVPACAAAPDDLTATEAALRTALGDRVMDHHLSLEHAHVGCADAGGARVVVLDRGLTTQRIVVVGPAGARTIRATSARATLETSRLVELTGDDAAEWVLREVAELGDEGAHTTTRCFLAGTSFRRLVPLPAGRPGLCPRAVLFRGGVGFVGEDAIHVLRGDRFEPVPVDDESRRVLDLRAAWRIADDAWRTADRFLTVQTCRGDQYCAERLQRALIDLGIPPESATTLVSAVFDAS